MFGKIQIKTKDDRLSGAETMTRPARAGVPSPAPGEGLLPRSRPGRPAPRFPGALLPLPTSVPRSPAHVHRPVPPVHRRSLSTPGRTPRHSPPGSGRPGLSCLLSGQFPGASAALSLPKGNGVWISLGKQSVLKKSTFSALKLVYDLAPTYPEISPHNLRRPPPLPIQEPHPGRPTCPAPWRNLSYFSIDAPFNCSAPPLSIY